MHQNLRIRAGGRRRQRLTTSINKLRIYCIPLHHNASHKSLVLIFTPTRMRELMLKLRGRFLPFSSMIGSASRWHWRRRWKTLRFYLIQVVLLGLYAVYRNDLALLRSRPSAAHATGPRVQLHVAVDDAQGGPAAGDLAQPQTESALAAPDTTDKTSRASKVSLKHTSFQCDEMTTSKVSVEAWVSAARNHRVREGCSQSVTEYAQAPPKGGPPGCDMFAWHGRPMFASVWEQSIRCALLPEDVPATTPEQVSVNVAVSDETLAKVQQLSETWGQRASEAGATLQFFAHEPVIKQADTAILDAVGRIGKFWPLNGQAAGAPLVSMALPLLAIVEAARDITNNDDEVDPFRWHVFVTDDTYLQLDEAVASLQFYNHRLPVLMGHIDSGKATLSYGLTDHDAGMRSQVGAMATRPAGPAGVILSSAALRVLGAALGSSLSSGSAAGGDGYYAGCSWPPSAQSRAQRWDFVLGRCCWEAGVPQLHNPLMLASLDSTVGKAWHMDRNQAPLECLATIPGAAGGRYSYERMDRSNRSLDDTHLTIHHGLRFKLHPDAFIDDRG